MNLNLNKMAVIVAIIGGLSTVATLVIIPHRVSKLEEQAAATEQKVDKYSELLIRIDENVKELRRRADQQRSEKKG